MSGIDNELFRFADNMRCKGYYWDTVSEISYIRPLTSVLHKEINYVKSKMVYEHMTDFLRGYKRPYSNADVSCVLKEVENAITIFDKTEIEILKRREDLLCCYFSHLHDNNLNDVKEGLFVELSEPESIGLSESKIKIKQEEIKEKMIKKIDRHFLSVRMEDYLKYLFKMDLLYDTEREVHDFFYKNFFVPYDFNKANVILSNIGFMIKDKDLFDILNYDNSNYAKWKDTEKKLIEDEVLKFANGYGLLGVLSKIYSFDESGKRMYYSYYNELANIAVTTILADAISATTSDEYESGTMLEKINREKPNLMPMMNVKKYLKIFFPEDKRISFELYQLQDERYWNIYSEPVYVFLLGAKIYYDEYFRYQKYHNNHKYGDSCDTIKQLPIVSKVNFTYNTATEGYVMDYTFRSLLEGLLFYSKKRLIHSSNTVIYCEICGKPVSGKNPKKKPKYCDKNCRERVSSSIYYEKNTEKIKEKRRIKTVERKVAGEPKE